MGLASVAAFLVMVAVLAAAFMVGQRRVMRKPGYADGNEARAVEGVLAVACSAAGTGDVRYRALDALGWRLALSKAGYFGYVFKPDDLELLEPFTEQWLSGALPHLLSEEYDDEIRVPLLKFKARMQDHGLWPQSRAVEAALSQGCVDPAKGGH
jgi:hypothetical protein